MSHHTHVFLSNEETADSCMAFVNSQINDEGFLRSNWVDYFEIIGALNLNTGEFTKYKYCTEDYKYEPDTIEKMETWANSLFGIEKYQQLIDTLDNHLKNFHFWEAARVCEELDGIAYPVQKAKKWTAKEPFPVLEGYIKWNGISDYRTIEVASEAEFVPAENYAVLVDFHS